MVNQSERNRGYSPRGFANQLFLYPPCLLFFFGCLYWLKVFFPNTKWILRISVFFLCYFFLCVSVNCYVSCLVCVAVCVSRSHSLYFLKNVFQCYLLFSLPSLQRIVTWEERWEEESMGPPFFPRFGREKSKPQGK
jgi:hypothetical protein